VCDTCSTRATNKREKNSMKCFNLRQKIQTLERQIEMTTEFIELKQPAFDVALNQFRSSENSVRTAYTTYTDNLEAFRGYRNQPDVDPDNMQNLQEATDTAEADFNAMDLAGEPIREVYGRATLDYNNIRSDLRRLGKMKDDAVNELAKSS